MTFSVEFTSLFIRTGCRPIPGPHKRHQKTISETISEGEAHEPHVYLNVKSGSRKQTTQQDFLCSFRNQWDSSSGLMMLDPAPTFKQYIWAKNTRKNNYVVYSMEGIWKKGLSSLLLKNLQSSFKEIATWSMSCSKSVHSIGGSSDEYN